MSNRSVRLQPLEEQGTVEYINRQIWTCSLSRPPKDVEVKALYRFPLNGCPHLRADCYKERR